MTLKKCLFKIHVQIAENDTILRSVTICFFFITEKKTTTQKPKQISLKQNEFIKGIVPGCYL